MATPRIRSSVVVALLISCGGSSTQDAGVDTFRFGEVTGASCPPTSQLSYANFGETFMTQYCTRCHASTLGGDARMGAPIGHNFDRQVTIRAFAMHIDQVAGSGPAATNELMPPDGAVPSVGERAQLAEWLACGAP